MSPTSLENHLDHPQSSQPSRGSVDAKVVVLLENSISSGHEEIDVDADHHAREAHHKSLPWYKAPAPWWLLAIYPLSAITMSATFAPKIEVYTRLACSVHRPNVLRLMMLGHDHLFDTARGLFETPRNGLITELSKGFSVFLIPAVWGKGNSDFIDSQSTCASDPAVQAAVARLSAVITTSTGVLSCLTTGWWGSFSDRRGRTRLLSISAFGILCTDLSFIFVSRNYKQLPGGYWYLILGPILSGLLGGTPTLDAAIHAYIADTTNAESQSHNLSFTSGLFFVGTTIGPASGSLIISITGNLLSVFFAAAAINFIYALFVWFILPESLLKSEMQQSKAKYDDECRNTLPDVGLFAAARKALKPLDVFLPALSVGESWARRRDWNLTILATVYGLTVTLNGFYIYKLQYATVAFGWTSETLGYFMTLNSAARAVFLTFILPYIIKNLKPKSTRDVPPCTSNTDDTQPLLSGAAQLKSHSSSFELGIAQLSLLIDIISYTCLAIITTAPVFITSSVAMSMGAGLSPALQSVALALYRRRGGKETGQLFGALGFMYALSSEAIGPAVYGLLYANTVGKFPKAIFILSTMTAITAFALLTLLRLPKEDVNLRGLPDGDGPFINAEREARYQST